MSKNILGNSSGNVILDLTTSNISASNLTASSSLNGSYLSANRGLSTDSNKKLVSTTATATEIEFLQGVSSNIQTQLNAKQPEITTSARLNANLIGADGSVSNAEFNTLDGIDTTQTIKTQLDNKLSTATAAIVYFTNIAAQGKQDKLENQDGSRLNANHIGDGSVGNNEFETLNGIDTSQTINTQLNGKQNVILNQNGSRLDASFIATGAVSNSEYATLSDIDTSQSIQTQLNGKQATIGNGDLTIARTDGLQAALDAISAPSITASRVCVSDSGGSLTASGITTTELNRLNNISQNIQTTLNDKLNNSSREFNSDNAEGQVRLRINSSTSDFSSSAGTSLSKFVIRSRHHRNAGGTVVNTQNTNVFGVFSFRNSDNNDDNQRCDLRNGQFRSNSTEYLSDDRLKWDEQPITNGLDTLMKLKPQVYQKYTTYNISDTSIRPSADEYGNGIKEMGFIAQEVAQIPELSFLVGSDKNYFQEDMPIYALNYNGIFVLAVQAIQELKQELDDVKQRLSYLENKN